MRERRRLTANKTALAALDSRYETPDVSPGFVLWRVATVWQRAVRAALEELGLTHSQFALLASAAWLEAHRSKHDKPVTQVLIAAHAKIDIVMTSEVLRTLERKALLRRLAHPTDARAKRIIVTRAGQRVVRRAVPLVEAVDGAFFASPGPDLQALAELLCDRAAGHRR